MTPTPFGSTAQVSTEVVFHFNVEQPLVYAGRLARKAYRLGQPLTLWCQSEDIQWLDEWLWSHDPLAFVPHAAPGQAQAVLDRSPIRLTDSVSAVVGSVVVNLTGKPIPELSAFNKVIEIVGADPSERDAARQRWRMYQSQGARPIGHDAAVS